MALVDQPETAQPVTAWVHPPRRRGRRVPRPLLLLLVLGMLFLPFLTVSCTSPLGGAATVEFSGWDSTLGTDPTVKGLGDDAGGESTPDAAETAEASSDSPAQQRLDQTRILLGWGFLAIVLIGTVVLFFIRSSRARSATAIAASVLAGGVLLLNHTALTLYLSRAIASADSEGGASEPDLFADVDLADFVSVESRWGLWCTMAYLALFAGGNVLRLLYPARTATERVAPFGDVPPFVP